MKKKLFGIVLVVVTMLVLSTTAFAISGEGTENNPYLIETEEDFLMVGYFPQQYFELAGDISVSTKLNDFEGVMDGNGFTIITTEEYVFSNNSGKIAGLTISGGKLATVNSESGSIENCIAQGSVVVETNNGKLSNIQSNTDIVKTNNGTIKGSSSSAGYIAVTNSESGTITSCSDSLHISNINNGLIENCSSTDGFLVNNNTGAITNCSTTNCYLVSSNSGIIKKSFTTGDKEIEDNAVFVITNTGTIDLCYSDLDVYYYHITSKTYNNFNYTAGGFVGSNNGTINRCYYDGTVSADVYVTSKKDEGVNTCYVGGIAGVNSGTISNCYAKGKAKVKFQALTASNVAYGDSYLWMASITSKGGNVENCYSDMELEVITNSDAYFDMTSHVYGIAGNSNIKNCYYSGGDVALSGQYGKWEEQTEGTYRRYTVTVPFSKTQVAGVGGKFEDNTIEKSYYLSDAPFEDDTTCGTPLLSSAMKMQTMYEDWDFDTIWAMNSERNNGYPYLMWQPEEQEPEEIVNVSAITISKDEVDLEVGGTTSLDITITPDNATNKNVKWTSSDEDVVTVVDGTVTAVGEGSATVIATTEDGNYKAMCSITVVKNNESTEPDEPNNDTTTTLRIDSGTGTAGESVAVALNVENNPGILGMMIKLTYDERLVLTSITQSVEDDNSALKTLDFTVSGDITTIPLNIAWEGLEADSTNGKILNMIFTIPENAQEGDIYDISVSYTKGEIYDDDLNDIEVELVDGSITVENYTIGNLNDDDVINIKDITLLRRGVVGGYEITLNKAADVNCDGTINIKDITILRRFVIGGYGVSLGK